MRKCSSLCLISTVASAAIGVLAADEAIRRAPVAEEVGSTKMLWLESATVQPAWEGDNLARVVDDETGSLCLEWSQNPALGGSATLALPGVRLEDFDAVRLQWKFIGGGSLLMVQTGGRNWYLNKERYNPDRWNDVWLDLNLDDDRIGATTNAQGQLVFKLLFSNSPLKRADEKEWRRIRVRDVRLVKFPVQLTCDARDVVSAWEPERVVTRFPLVVSNATRRTQSVSLSLDPRECVRFTPAFSRSRVSLAPGAAEKVTLTFTLPVEAAAALPPLTFEQTPVYAMIDGEPLSLTTWYRGYVVWKVGGVVPPRNLKRPYMVPAGNRALVTAGESNAIVRRAEAALGEPVLVHDIRHGYPTGYKCPVHGHTYEINLDLVNFRKHRCVKGEHDLEGYEHLDKEAGIRKHSMNSGACHALGQAYWLTGDARYARKAADWLLAYAAKFPGWTYAYPRGPATGYHCRVGHAVLGECWWVHGFNAGYDLVAGAPCITPAERAVIERDFFAIEGDDVQVHRVCVNQQCEINSAAGCAAINAGNWYLAARTFTGDYGLFDQVELTFSEDGFSLENELPYHFAALGPITQLGEVYEALGGTFFTPRVKRIFDAPIAFSPNASPGNAPLYRKAARLFHDDSYLFDESAERPLGNSTLEMAGRTTLRRGTTARYQSVQIMWGGSTWRGGRDLLNYLTPLNTSISRVSYGVSLPTPYLSYSTLGGNVPEVDGLNQTGNRARQTAILGGDFPAAKFEAPLRIPLYPGVAATRVVAIIDEAYVVVDRLRADKPRRFSFSFHCPGAVTATPDLAFDAYPAFHGEAPGRLYQAVTNPAVARGVNRWAVEYKIEGSKEGPQAGRWQGLLDGAGELIKGEAWNGWWPTLKPMFLARRQAATVACVQVLDEAPARPVTAFELLPLTVDGKAVAHHEGAAVALTTAKGRFLLIDCDLPGLKQAGGAETRERLWVGRAP